MTLLTAEEREAIEERADPKWINALGKQDADDRRRLLSAYYAVEKRVSELEAICSTMTNSTHYQLASECDSLSARCAVLEKLWAHCHVTYWPPDGAYPIEHNPHARKDCRAMIEAALEAK